MLRVVENGKRVESFQKMFVRSVTRAAEKPKSHLIGFPGGVLRAPTYRFRGLGMWMASIKLRNRYWNAFGIGDPFATHAPAPHVEINFPFRGINRRIAGSFLEDESGGLYVGHSGKVGGGTKGVSKSDLLRYYPATSTVLSGVKKVAVYVLGRLDAKDLSTRIARFTEISRDFRQAIRDGKKLGAASPGKGHHFHKEAEGAYVYTTSEQVAAERNHGIIVKALRDELRKCGIEAWNTVNRDLYTNSTQGATAALFEVKTGSDTTNVYTAIGQLFFHGGTGTAKRLVAVLPRDTSRDKVARLSNLGISTVRFRLDKNGTVSFQGLEEVI